MAKISEGTLQPDVATSKKLGVVFNRTKNGTVVQAWPRKRGRAKEGYDLYRQLEFGLVARNTAYCDATTRQTAEGIAQGSDQVWRDILQMAMMGTLITITGGDGAVSIPERKLDPNAQLILDQVTDEPGSILVRLTDGWFGLAGPSMPSFLYSKDNVPQWVQTIPSEQPPGAPMIAGLLDLTSGSNINVNSVGGVALWLPAGTIVNRLHAYCVTAQATTTNQPAVYSRAGNAPSALQASGAIITGVTQGVMTWPLSAPFVVATADMYFLAIQTKVAAWSQATNSFAIWGWAGTAGASLPNPMGAITDSFAANFPKLWYS